MSVHRVTKVTCDFCGVSETHDTMADAFAWGWRVRRSGAGTRHECPACLARERRGA